MGPAATRWNQRRRWFHQRSLYRCKLQSLQDATRDAEVGETLRAQLPALTPVALTSPVPEIAQERQRRERYADCLLDGMAGALERPRADRWATAPWMSETTISDGWFTDWVPWVALVARECAGVWADAPRMSATEYAVLEIGRATELMVWIGLAGPRLEVGCEYWATWRTTVPDGMLLEAHEERGPDAARAYREAERRRRSGSTPGAGCCADGTGLVTWPMPPRGRLFFCLCAIARLCSPPAAVQPFQHGHPCINALRDSGIPARPDSGFCRRFRSQPVR